MICRSQLYEDLGTAPDSCRGRSSYRLRFGRLVAAAVLAGHRRHAGLTSSRMPFIHPERMTGVIVNDAPPSAPSRAGDIANWSRLVPREPHLQPMTDQGQGHDHGSVCCHRIISTAHRYAIERIMRDIGHHSIDSNSDDLASARCVRIGLRVSPAVHCQPQFTSIFVCVCFSTTGAAQV